MSPSKTLTCDSCRGPEDDLGRVGWAGERGEGSAAVAPGARRWPSRERRATRQTVQEQKLQALAAGGKEETARGTTFRQCPSVVLSLVCQSNLA